LAGDGRRARTNGGRDEPSFQCSLYFLGRKTRDLQGPFEVSLDGGAYKLKRVKGCFALALPLAYQCIRLSLALPFAKANWQMANDFILETKMFKNDFKPSFVSKGPLNMAVLSKIR
jgi:hypothetical protein